MKQKITTLLIVILIAGLMSLVVVGSNKKEQQANDQKLEAIKNGEPIFYFGATCPHCKDVEKWFEENKIEEKIKFTKKEVWNDRQNAAELGKVAASCNLDVNNIGVPFLYADQKCLIGTPDIIKYFSEKLGIEATPEATVSGLGSEGTPSAATK